MFFVCVCNINRLRAALFSKASFASSSSTKCVPLLLFSVFLPFLRVSLSVHLRSLKITPIPGFSAKILQREGTSSSSLFVPTPSSGWLRTCRSRQALRTAAWRNFFKERFLKESTKWFLEEWKKWFLDHFLQLVSMDDNECVFFECISLDV